MDLEQLNELSATKNAPKKISTSGKILIGLTGIHFFQYRNEFKLSLSMCTIISSPGGIAIGFSIICYPFVAPAFRKYCLPYVPATTNQIDNILIALRSGRSLTNNKLTDTPIVKQHQRRLLDIGSGDGRIVIGTSLYKSTNYSFFNVVRRLYSGRQKWLRCRWCRIESVVGTVLKIGRTNKWCGQSDGIFSPRFVDVQLGSIRKYRYFWRRTNGLVKLKFGNKTQEIIFGLILDG